MHEYVQRCPYCVGDAMQATLARLNDLPAPGSSTALTTMQVPAEQQQAAALAQALALQRLLSSQRPGSGEIHLFLHLPINQNIYSYDTSYSMYRICSLLVRFLCILCSSDGPIHAIQYAVIRPCRPYSARTAVVSRTNS